MPSASVSGVLRYAVVNADFYAPAASKEYLPARKKRLLKIAVFGLVGEAPNYWRSEVLDGGFVLEKYPKYERILFRAAARYVVGD